MTFFYPINPPKCPLGCRGVNFFYVGTILRSIRICLPNLVMIGPAVWPPILNRHTHTHTQNSKNPKKLDRDQPTHPPPYPIFFFWKLISDPARTLKSQWPLTTFNNVYTDRIHHITLIPHEYSIPTLEII